MSENKKHLFVCAIGPVQDFIATARTSHDLWFGSWMLSELSKAAARAISGEPHQLIFPAPEQDLEPGSVLGSGYILTDDAPNGILFPKIDQEERQYDPNYNHASLHKMQ